MKASESSGGGPGCGLVIPLQGGDQMGEGQCDGLDDRNSPSNGVTGLILTSKVVLSVA